MNAEQVDAQAADPSRPDRRPDIDWVRALAVLLLVPFHSALVFGSSRGYHINTGENYAPLQYFAGIVHQWHMPLLFVVSGMGTWFALTFRTAGRYARERVTRLLVPLVFGTLVIVPPQTYCQRLSEGKFHGSYLAFYPHFFDGVYGVSPDGNFAYNHLWFIAYLLVFSMLSLPLLAWFRREGGRRLLSGLAASCEKRGAIFLFAIPVGVTEAVLRAKFPGLQTLVSDWANFTQYLFLFLLGFVICSDGRFWQAIERHGPAALVCGVLTMSFGVALHLTGTYPAWGYTPGWLAMRFVLAFNTWFWIIALLWAGKKTLSFESGLLPYIREGSYPFYVLHQTVLIAIGYHVMNWPIGVMPRYLILVVTTIIATTLIYDAFVRRFNVVRFLFGMKPKRR